MKKESFLRIQLIMQDNGATSFESNLAKMISVVLFNTSTKLTIGEIKNELLNSYELEFTDEEIENAINKKHSGILKEQQKIQISRHSNTYDLVQDYYLLSSEMVDKYKRKLDNNYEDQVIERFLNENNDVIYSVEEFKGILHNFLYGVFNSNKDTLMLFMNETSKVISGTDEVDEFKEVQKRAINTFLNWNNPHKDQLIYQTVSYCVEYCLLNVKKGYSSFQNIFRGKKFYLDTNVILRLAGINNEERKTVITSFIKKCKENGIQLLYTNYTYQEIKDTIHRNIAEVKKIMNGHRMVSGKHWKYYSKPSTNLDFIELYDNWCKEPGSDYADYSMFEKSIMRTIENILREFKKEEYLGYEKKGDSDYKPLTEELSAYKKDHGANHYEKSISTDINNFMYVRNLRKRNGLNISDIKEYLISTDANLCNWSKEVMPGTIPIAVLPSVWYSLILKFKGRANDDYKAFNLFLNLRFKTQDTPLDNQKDRILRLVQNLNEPTDIKNLILDEIADKINSNSLEQVNPEKIIDEAKNSVILNEIDKRFQQYKGNAIDEIDKQVEIRTLHSLAEARANKRVRSYKAIDSIMNIVRFICGVAIIISLILVFIEKINLPELMVVNIFGYSLESWGGLLSWLIPLVLWLVISPIKKVVGHYFSFDEIKERELLKLQKDIGKTL